MRRLFTWCLASAFLAAAYVAPSAQSRSTPKPNYELAADWTAQKVGRLVFDTNVTPRWLETSDRFWYAFQTREGRKFYLVDPLKKTKAPLFDHAKMAATLTSITREPYDAQHLPFTTVKFVKKDAAFQFDVQVPRDADVVKPKRPTTTSSKTASRRDSAAAAPQQVEARSPRRIARSISSTTWRAAASSCSTTTTKVRSVRDGRPSRPTARRSSSRAITTSS